MFGIERRPVFLGKNILILGVKTPHLYTDSHVKEVLSCLSTLANEANPRQYSLLTNSLQCYNLDHVDNISQHYFNLTRSNVHEAFY